MTNKKGIFSFVRITLLVSLIATSVNFILNSKNKAQKPENTKNMINQIKSLDKKIESLKGKISLIDKSINQNHSEILSSIDKLKNTKSTAIEDYNQELKNILDDKSTEQEKLKRINNLGIHNNKIIEEYKLLFEGIA